MRMNNQTRWRVLAVGVALFAALALTACSQGNDSGQTTTDEASINESATLKITGATGASSPSDTTTIQDSADVDVTDGDGSGSSNTDTAAITESIAKDVQSSPPGGGGGGGGDRTFIQDSVSFVVRDSDGVVKDQGILN